ncbi:MAG: ABC transporter permease [Alphaproteobacteria bacterium]|uniref:ABC transporter permease n=1 Tax=Futiania mangrovi TaxID=2959716 RepID=A0A9J6P7S6_9PROT|nr:ABC transporter permease [Futiania mangrovii]MCP1335084.1 ABC transporter permease [Futiania mangrovii]MDX5361251.1 ABC transporter permease [Alphaproteobacteria bacterium]MDX5369409.1 ABC transporter permease [Alphaproteobacteria bacterium]MDX5464092.1 ABC transporter permease [Alphaproteobacteria bacterium]
MLILTLRRLASMVLIMITVSVILFVIFEGDKVNVARKVLGPYAQADQLQIWLEQNGYNRALWVRYFEWAGNFLTGDFGQSIRYRVPVSEVLWPRLANTGILAFFVFLIMIPLSLTLGVLAGMKEGSMRDRTISVVSIITTSIPEFASATFLLVVFVFTLGWLPGTSGFANGFSFVELILPVAVLVIYDFGYVARMTRASMAEVMTSQYIRTAILKGLPYGRVIMRHALRNALIAPFTVIVLQLNWLLSGVIVTEMVFAYKGYGALMLDAALFGDIYVIQACTMVAVAIAVLSQFISDIGYTLLNPRIRFS